MLYRFGKAETGINEAIQHRFQAGSKHGFRSFRLFFGFRIEINRNKTIHPPIRQPGIRRRPPDKETVNRGNRDAGKTGMRKKPGHGESQDTRAERSRTEPNGGYRIQPSFRTTRAHRTLGASRMARVPQLSRRRRTLRGHQSSGQPGLGQARPTRNAGAHATPGTHGVASRRCGRGGHPVKMVA